MPKSADSRQLLSRQHRDDPFAADDRPQNHHAGVLGHDFADNGGITAERMGRMTSRSCPASLGGTTAISFPSLATYKGSSPSISQAPRTSGLSGMADSFSLTPTLRGRRQFVQGAGQSAARRITHATDGGTGFEHDTRQIVQRRRIAFQDRLEFDALAHRHDGDAVIAERSGNQDLVARPSRADGQLRAPAAPDRCRTW